MPLDLPNQIAAAIRLRNLLNPSDRLGVAVSGGADSVALLHILHSFALYDMVVLHVNHHLRGKESDADEEFVSNLADNLSVPIEIHHAPLGAGNMEQNARDARRAFFFAARQRLALHRVALGHNQSDQAETVLYRFLRGSGLAGLAGMLPVTADHIIRPMLSVTREEIRTWAAEQGIVWREDSSNQDTQIVRNRLRLEVFNPQFVQVLSATATVAQDEEAWWSVRIAELYDSSVQRAAIGLQFSVSGLVALHPAEQRRLLRHAIREVKGDLKSIDLSHVEALRRLLDSEVGHDRILIPGVDGLRSFGTLLLARTGRIGNEPRHYQMMTEIGKELALPYSGGRLYVNWIKRDDQFCGNFGVEAGSDQEVIDLDVESLNRVGLLSGLKIRNWEPGDEYRRTGHRKSEKIKSLFQEHRIVLWDRRRWPVMVLQDQIVWVRRFGAAAEFQAHDESRSVLRCVFTS